MINTVVHGDCIDVLRLLPENSIDSVVTDPPYGLGVVNDLAGLLTSWMNGDDGYEHAQKFGFMNKTWDALCPSPRYWRALYRVMKPGAYLLAFAGTRTWDLMSMAIRLAGFEDRDTIASEFGVSALSWVYGEGMPKSHKLNNGTWGTNLKPAWEPILCFRKPVVGTITSNTARYRTGGINIDGCRVSYQSETDSKPKNYTHNKGIGTYQQLLKDHGARKYTDGFSYQKNDFVSETHPKGRWPANLVFVHGEKCEENQCEDTCPIVALDHQTGLRKSGGGIKQKAGRTIGLLQGEETYHFARDGREWQSSEGGASRYFNQFYYEPKAKKKEKEAGCEELPMQQGFDKNTSKTIVRSHPETGKQETFEYVPSNYKNTNPCVKPINLMKWLVTLVTPEHGIVLDPFCGSGSTCVAALQTGFRFLGIENEEQYVRISQARLAHAQKEIKHS